MNMPAQGTEQWHAARKGRITASVIGKVITGSGKDEVLRDMVRDALGYPRAFIGNVATEWGTQNEDDARTEYALETGRSPVETGFHLHPEHHWLGASPDGLVGDDGLIEIKCPFKLRDAVEVPDELLELGDRDLYWHQMQCQMAVMDRDWCDFAVWCPGEIKVRRYLRDNIWLAIATDTCLPWLEYLKDVLADPEEAERIAVEGVKHKGSAPDNLPALSIELDGAVTASNLPDFKARALAMIDGIKTELVTDKDFADAESTVKFLQKGEKQLEASKQAALEQTASIAEVFATIDELTETMRHKRLHLGKLVKAEKDNRRLEIQQKAIKGFEDWILSLDTPVPISDTLDVYGAMKSKKTITMLQAAADDEVARAKIECQQIANEVNSNKSLLDKEQGECGFLFSDWRELIQQHRDDLQAVIAARIAQHRAAEQVKFDAERDRIRQEEEAKARKHAEEEARQHAQALAAQEKDAMRAQEAEAKSHQPPRQDYTEQHSPQPWQQEAALNTVTITCEEYDRLLAAEAMLVALKDAGVARWSKYQTVMENLAA